jgi:beta-1,4-N-acetylglucosaminyltransferase
MGNILKCFIPNLAVCAAALFSLVILSLIRLACILPIFSPKPPSPHRTSARLLIVLGSGGHTAEMLRLLQPLNFNKYVHRSYIVTSGDTLSESKAREFEKQTQTSVHPSVDLSSFEINYVPRARKVGQSWLTTMFTSLHCLTASFTAVLRSPLPDAVLPPTIHTNPDPLQRSRNLRPNMSSRLTSAGTAL